MRSLKPIPFQKSKFKVCRRSCETPDREKETVRLSIVHPAPAWQDSLARSALLGRETLPEPALEALRAWPCRRRAEARERRRSSAAGAGESPVAGAKSPGHHAPACRQAGVPPREHRSAYGFLLRIIRGHIGAPVNPRSVK